MQPYSASWAGDRLAIAMRDAGDILTLAENVRSEMADIKANLPVGIEPVLVADQAVTVDTAINEFLTSLWQAIVIILACSFVSLGMRPGTVVALAIPLTLAIVFAVLDVANIDCNIHGRADHRAGLLGRRRHDDGHPSAPAPATPDQAATFAIAAGRAGADRHAGHDPRAATHRL
jgi:hypothetical protein